MWNVCPKCNHLNNDDSKRCEQCGYRLSEARRFEEPKRHQQPPQAVTETVAYRQTSYQPPLPEPRPGRNYFDEWLRSSVDSRARRRNGAIVAAATILCLFAIGYAAVGLICNTLVWIALALVIAWAIRGSTKGNWTDGKTAAVILFIIIPMFVFAIFPLQPWFAEMGEQRVPVFVDDISYGVVDGTLLVVDGYVTNQGNAGGQAMVQISAFAGYPEYSNYSGDMSDSFAQETIYTGWLEPGQTFRVHWEHTFPYFNDSGTVTWSIVPVGSE